MNQHITDIVAAAKTSELVAFYNDNAVKTVTKFADRATAEKRVAQMITDMVAAGQFCPVCDTLAKHGLDITYAGPEGGKNAANYLHHHCGKEYRPDGSVPKAAAAPSADRSAAIAATWADPEVAAARAQRSKVVVEGRGEFRSVKAAFIALGLPVSKHIPFRMQLKAKGAALFDRYTFAVVSK
jgi:hypothetical protein